MVEGYITTQNGEKTERIAKINIFDLQSVKDKSLIQLKIDEEVYSCMAIENNSVWEFWVAKIFRNHNQVYSTFIEKIDNYEAFFKLFKSETAWLV